MEQEKIITSVSEQGVNAEKLFHGKMEGHAAELFYTESAGLFASIISKEIPKGTYSLVDLGGHKGELLSEIASLLPDYKFNSTVVDRVEGLDPGVDGEKIVGDITHTSFESKNADIVFLRYVLAWNTTEGQREILKEVARITKRIAIIQHQGADSANPGLLQEAQARLFSGEIPELKRDPNFMWTDPRSLESLMMELGIKYSIVQDRRIDGLSDLFIEKYGLAGSKAEAVREILRNCDYVMQTTWVLDFTENV